MKITGLVLLFGLVSTVSFGMSISDSGTDQDSMQKEISCEDFTNLGEAQQLLAASQLALPFLQGTTQEAFDAHMAAQAHYDANPNDEQAKAEAIAAGELYTVLLNSLHNLMDLIENLQKLLSACSGNDGSVGR